MQSFNQVILIGNLTRDPEVKFTTSNKAVAQLGLAVNEAWKDAAGQKKESVTFIDVEVWGQAAEFAGKYMSKGTPAFIVGRLKLDTWEDKQGGKRSKLKVVADKIQSLAARTESAPRQQPQPAAAAPVQVTEDDIPFD